MSQTFRNLRLLIPTRLATLATRKEAPLHKRGGVLAQKEGQPLVSYKGTKTSHSPLLSREGGRQERANCDE